MEELIRGTTPSFILDFSDTGISVSEISRAVLTITHRGRRKFLFLEDLDVDVKNKTISYHFTQQETLAFSAKKPVKFQFDFVANGERYRGYLGETLVVGTKYNEVL